MMQRGNNFNLIRALAALSVLVSHCYPLAEGPQSTEPLEQLFTFSLGHLAVLIFFVISGYFISQSFSRSGSLAEFTVARVLRIYPALVVCLFITALVLGPLLTTDSNYWSHPGAYSYIAARLGLAFGQDSLPGVFEDNPYPRAINGSLWTLFYEVTCYIMAAVVGWHAKRSGRAPAIFFAVYAAAYIAIWRISPHLSLRARHFFDLTPSFVLGMALFYYPLKPRMAHVLALLGVAFVLSHTDFYREALYLLIASVVFLVGPRRTPILRHYNNLGDYSYGIYIYSYPVMQSVACLKLGTTPFHLLAVSVPATIALAVLSWHLIEKPALGLKLHLSNRRQEQRSIG